MLVTSVVFKLSQKLTPPPKKIDMMSFGCIPIGWIILSRLTCPLQSSFLTPPPPPPMAKKSTRKLISCFLSLATMFVCRSPAPALLIPIFCSFMTSPSPPAMFLIGCRTLTYQFENKKKKKYNLRTVLVSSKTSSFISASTAAPTPSTGRRWLPWPGSARPITAGRHPLSQPIRFHRVLTAHIYNWSWMRCHVSSMRLTPRPPKRWQWNER